MSVIPPRWLSASTAAKGWHPISTRSLSAGIQRCLSICRKHIGSLPSGHPGELCSWDSETGSATAQVVEAILSRKAYPEQGFRSCLGIISLAKRYTKERLEAACTRALSIKGISYRSIKSILDNNLDQKPLLQQPELLPVTPRWSKSFQLTKHGWMSRIPCRSSEPLNALEAWGYVSFHFSSGYRTPPPAVTAPAPADVPLYRYLQAPPPENQPSCQP